MSLDALKIVQLSTPHAPPIKAELFMLNRMKPYLLNVAIVTPCAIAMT